MNGNASQNTKGSHIAKLRVGGLAVLVSDMDDAVEFYRDVLGMKLWNTGSFEATYRGKPIAVKLSFLEGLGTSIELLCSTATGRKPRPDPPAHLFTADHKALILYTDDWAATVQELRERGANFLWDDMVQSDGSGCAMILDPSNNMIEIVGPPGFYARDELIVSDLKDGRKREYPPRVDQFVGAGQPRLIHDGKLLSDKTQN